MDALRQSVAQEKTASTPQKKKSPKRFDGQGEMLLPIAGKAKKVVTATRNGQAPDKRTSVDPHSTAALIPARKSRRRFENNPIADA